MNPDVTLNFLANMVLAVGLILLFPIRQGLWKRLGLIAVVVAALLNVALMIENTHRIVCPSELLLNCCIAYYVAVLVIERKRHGATE